MTSSDNLLTLIRCGAELNPEFHENMHTVFGEKAPELIQLIADNLAEHIMQLAGETSQEAAETQPEPVVEYDQSDDFSWFKEKGAVIEHTDAQLITDNLEWFTEMRSHFDNNTMTEELAKDMREFMGQLLTPSTASLTDGVELTPVVTPTRRKPTQPVQTNAVSVDVVIAQAQQETAYDASSMVQTTEICPVLLRTTLEECINANTGFTNATVASVVAALRDKGAAMEKDSLEEAVRALPRTNGAKFIWMGSTIVKNTSN